MPRPRPLWWRRKRPDQYAYRCGGCGWHPPDPITGRVYGRHDARFIGHAPACPTRFAWITSPEQLADMREVLLRWAAEQERISSDPEWLLTDSGDWRQARDVWAQGMTHLATMRGWER